MQTNDTARIPLYTKHGTIRAYATVDAADAAWANQWVWKLSTNDGYAWRSEKIDGKFVTISLHRALLGLRQGDGIEGDHIDRDRLNNRRSNLRALPKGANGQNRQSLPGSTSKYRGVCWDKRSRRWKAAVHFQGKVMNLGYFDSEEDAAAAARSVRLRLMPYAVD